MTKHLRAIFNSYSEVFFLKGLPVGVLMMGLTLINPNVAIAGIVAVIASYLFARFINMDQEFLKSGFYTYNPLLVGLSIGYLFQITPLTVFFVAIAGLFTFVVTHMMHSILSYYLRLPILSLPFVFVSSIAYLASSQYSNLFVSNLYPHDISDIDLYLPIWISGFLKSLGAILFIPDALAGLLLLAVILYSSRILFLLVIIGYYSGSLITAALVGSFQQAFSNINHFNYIWIAIAVGGIFLIPSIKSYLLAVLAVASSTLLLGSVEVFWANYGIPAFAMPFNLVSLAFIYVLGVTESPLITRVVKATPEDTLDYYLSTARRFTGHERSLSLPFAGQWMVWQGFDGKWTHQGSWKYAYDFVISDAQGETYRNDGNQLEDYYAFRKPVLSPVRGRVVRVINSLPDNPIGKVDKGNNWGNLVIIQDPRGFYVEISHFMTKSIVVGSGDWVEKGTMLGMCGNSGYSPQPHIHLQVQLSEAIGAMTLPFSFVSYVSNNRFFANDLPQTDTIVEPLAVDKGLDNSMTFILDQEYRYEVLKGGKKIDEMQMVVKMAPDGTFYFDSGKGKLYFGKSEGTFYFYQVEGNDKNLKTLFTALPRLPLAFKNQLSWEDYIPLATTTRGFTKAATLFLSSFYHGLDMLKTSCSYSSKMVIDGVVTSGFLKMKKTTRVILDEEGGISVATIGDTQLRRIRI